MSIHDENDGTIKGETLKDGILFEQTPNWLKFACPKTKPEFALKEVKQDGVTVAYEVPKSRVYFQATHKLADGSTVMLLRYKPQPQEVRESFHAAATAAYESGALQYKIATLSESSKSAGKSKPKKITFASLQ